MLKKMGKENEEYSFHSFLLTLALQTKTCILSTSEERDGNRVLISKWQTLLQERQEIDLLKQLAAENLFWFSRRVFSLTSY